MRYGCDLCDLDVELDDLTAAILHDGQTVGRTRKQGTVGACCKREDAIVQQALRACSRHSVETGDRSGKDQVFSEVADLHVEALASSSLVDVISTDRHTVKPWFQGRIPFAFNLPELQNSGFSLLGGRMTYLEQTPGAHLIYDVGKHHISVFVFQERSLSGRLNDGALQRGELSFNMETWSQGGLRYFVIGDASAANIDSLAKLFKTAS